MGIFFLWTKNVILDLIGVVYLINFFPNLFLKDESLL